MTNRKDWLPACSTSWDKPCAEVYRSLAEVGIHHVELCGKSPAFWQEMDFVHRAKDVVANMKQYGVAPSSMHLPFSPSAVMDPTDADADKRDAIVRLDGELLRTAADAGIPIAVTQPARNFPKTIWPVVTSVTCVVARVPASRSPLSIRVANRIAVRNAANA